MNTVNVGICGLGTVASGVVNVFARNASLIAARAGCDMRITHIGARRDNPACSTSGLKVSRDIFEVVNDANVDVVLELIGGTDTAKALVLAALKNGKHVITANKALIAEHGDELLAVATECGLQLRFEAAVAGGIPVIKSLTEGLSANRIESIVGIINGTGNFILSEMGDKGRSFDEALADAQRLGYAEADPTFDVEGVDAAQKLVILASLAFDMPFNAEACYTEGITALAVEDINYARELGYQVKHWALPEKSQSGLELRVHPALVPASRVLSHVNGVMNAVCIKGDAVGPTLYYGAGAGSEATASAVLADMVDVGKHVALTGTNQQRHSQPQSHSGQQITIVDIDHVESAFYLRIKAENKAGVLSHITQVLGESNISVEAVRQQEPSHAGEHPASIPIVLTTSLVSENKLRAAVNAIEGLDTVSESVVVIRIENLD